MQGLRYELTSPGEPVVKRDPVAFHPGAADVVVEIAGCGVCHTDLGFLDGSIRPRHALPLTLGHEISGRVVETGPAAAAWLGRAVIVPAVIPCGTCSLCRDGAGGICPTQIMPGNDDHGGFASHVVVPARGLCPIPEEALANRPPGYLASLSVIADAVSTPFQAVHRSGLGAGDFAVVVGLGGVGGFAVQIAAARGAVVAGIDVDPQKIEGLHGHGLGLGVEARGKDAREIRRTILDFVIERRLPTTRWRIFECSGTARGQETAFGLLGPGAHLSIVGFTRDPVNVRLSNLMAFDARCQGNWGCLPEHYPAALDLVLSGIVQIGPFVETHPLSSVNDVLKAAATHQIKSRAILVP